MQELVLWSSRRPGENKHGHSVSFPMTAFLPAHVYPWCVPPPLHTWDTPLSFCSSIILLIYECHWHLLPMSTTFIIISRFTFHQAQWLDIWDLHVELETLGSIPNSCLPCFSFKQGWMFLEMETSVYSLQMTNFNILQKLKWLFRKFFSITWKIRGVTF